MSGLASLSPVASARILVLVLPVGRISRSRFFEFFGLLTPASEIRLGDVTPDPRPDRTMFSPLHFPDGVLLYQFCNATPTPDHLALSPFELFREPLVVLGVADAKECDLSPMSEQDATPGLLAPFSSFLKDTREQHPRVLVHKGLLFDAPERVHEWRNDDVFVVPQLNQLKSTTMKTIICDITSTLLAEMTSLAKAMQALPSVPSPAVLTRAASGVGAESLGNDADTPQLNRLSDGRARLASPVIGGDQNTHRMSMPNLPDGSSAASFTGGSRPASPDTGVGTPPAKTFDEITNSSKVAAFGRTNSQDRVSVHGFGPGSLDEWNRNRGKNRTAIVVGSIYLLAGRWHDALNQLADGAVKARMYSDHLWHAKALELILVCMTLLSWAHMDYKIPTVCSPVPDRLPVIKPYQHGSNNAADPTVSATRYSTQIDLLGTLVPDLINLVISIYNRSPAINGEPLPQLALSEAIIRMAKVSAALNLAGGVFSDEALQHLVRGGRLNPSSDLHLPRLTMTPTRNATATFLLRAVPEDWSLTGVSSSDQLTILGAISALLSALGLKRKAALLMKEYVDVLTVALTETRTAGAAEAGVHPSSTYSASTTDRVEGPSGSFEDSISNHQHLLGVEALLSILCHVHGVPLPQSTRTAPSILTSRKELGRPLADSNLESGPQSQSVADSLYLRAYGNPNIKAEVLRCCILLCDALLDVKGVILYTSALLKAAAPGIPISPQGNDVPITLPREEQLSLMSKVIQTSILARNMGPSNIDAYFWDEFLVRGLYVLDPPGALRMYPVKRSFIRNANKSEKAAHKGPFLYDAFATKSDEKGNIRLLVCGEEREFVISLQNPYEFELGIESLKIISDGQSLGCSKTSLIVRPVRTQSFSVKITVAAAGQLRVDGCVAKVKGCRERFFHIFVEPWVPHPDIWMKNIGLINGLPESDSDTRQPVTLEERYGESQKLPVPTSISLIAVTEQPLLVMELTSISQKAMMLLEGELQAFSITVKNISKIAADYIRVICQDSATVAQQEAIAVKGLPAADVFAIERELASPALQEVDCQDGTKALQIPAGEHRTYNFEIFGKPGLTSASVTFEYANLRQVSDEAEVTFYARRLSLPIAVTVNASTQIQRIDVVPLYRSFPIRVETLRGKSSDLFQSCTGVVVHKITRAHLGTNDTGWHAELDKASKETEARTVTFTGEGFGLLVVDIRNAWPAPLAVSLFFRMEAVPSFDPGIPDSWGQKITIQPGRTERFVLPVPKLYIEHAQMSILRALRSTNERQFVVSTASVTAETERAQREMFWYRQLLVGMLSTSWAVEESNTRGIISLNQVPMRPRVLDAIKLDDVAISIRIVRPQDDRQSVLDGAYYIRVNDFVVMRTTVQNRTSHQRIHAMVCLRPSLPQQTQDKAVVDLDKRLVWSGLLQQRMKPLGPGEEAEVQIVLCALCAGEYEVAATVVEVRAATNSINEEQAAGTWEDGLHGPVLDSIALSAPKRTWTAKNVCRLIAVEES